MGVRGDLLNPVVRNSNETSVPPSLLLTTVGPQWCKVLVTNKVHAGVSSCGVNQPASVP